MFEGVFMYLTKIPPMCLLGEVFGARPTGGSSWKTQGLLERLNLSAGFGEVLCLPGLAGGGGWGEKDLGISKRLLHRPGKAAENEWMDLI